MMAIDDFTEEEFARAFNRNRRALLRGKQPSSNPVAILLGGQSGAGKTTIHRIKQVEFQGNIIVIDGDSFRSQHPHYLELQRHYGKDSVSHTKRFAGQMVEALIEDLSNGGFHLLIEGTLRTVEVPRETAVLLRQKGYQIQLAVIATKPKLSYISTLIRYEELYANNPTQARATSKENHDDIVDHIVGNLRQLEQEAIFQRIQIYQRSHVCLYDSTTDHQSASEVLEECLFGAWSQLEIEMLVKSEDRLRELEAARKA